MQDVDIRNVGGPRPRDGVASEATLAELLEAVKRSGGGGSTRTAETRAMDSFARSTREAAADQGTLSKAVAATEAALDAFEETIKNNTKRLSEFTENIIGNSNLITRSLNRFNYFVDENIDRFRSLSSIGASFGNSLNDLVSTAVDGKMGIGEFTSLVMENAEVLRSLSGTVTEGSKRFANLSTQLRAGRLGKELYSIGYTFSEINETLLNYIDISRRSMLNERMTDSELIQGTEAYVNELERLTKITGMSRKEAQAAMEQQMGDQRIRMQLAKMNPEEAARFQTNMAYLDNQVSGMGEVFRQLASMDPGDELTRMLQVFAPELASGARDMQNMTTGELHNFIASFGDQIDEMSTAMGEEQVAYLYRTNSVFREMFNMASQANRLSSLSEEERQRLDKELSSRSQLTSTFAYFEEQMRQVTGDIMNSFFDTANMTGGFNEAISELAKAFFGLINPQTAGSVTSLTDTFAGIISTLFGPEGSITRGIRSLTTFLQKDETKRTFENIMQKIKDFGNGLVDFFIGTEQRSAQAGERTGGLFRRLYSMFVNVIESEDTFTGILVESFKGIFNAIGEEIVSYFEIAAEAGQGPWSAILEQVTTSVLDWVEGNAEATDNNDFWSRLNGAIKVRVLSMFGEGEVSTEEVNTFWSSLWSRISTTASNWFNSEEVQAEVAAIDRYWNELTTAVGDALLWMFSIDRVNAGTGRTQTFWEAIFREIDQVIFGRLEAVQTPAGTQEVRNAETGLMPTIVNSLTTLFNAVGDAFVNFWEGPTGQRIETTITNFFVDLLDKLAIAIENSSMGWVTPFGGYAQEAEERGAARVVADPSGIDKDGAALIAKSIRDTIDSSTTTLSMALLGPLGVDIGGEEIRAAIDTLTESQVELVNKYAPSATESSLLGYTRTDRLVRAFDRMSAAASQGDLTSQEMATLGEIFKTIPKFNTGTIGFENFGKESVVKLHGYEAVVPRNTVQGDILSDFYSYQSGRQPDVVSAFSSIERKVDNALSKSPETDGIMSNISALIEKISNVDTPTPEMIPARSDVNQSQLINKIDELNKTMLQVVSLMSEEIQVQKRTMRGVQGMGHDLMKGIIR